MYKLNQLRFTATTLIIVFAMALALPIRAAAPQKPQPARTLVLGAGAKLAITNKGDGRFKFNFDGPAQQAGGQLTITDKSIAIVLSEGDRTSSLSLRMETTKTATLELNANGQAITYAVRLPDAVRGHQPPAVTLASGDLDAYRREAAKSQALGAMRALLTDAVKPKDSMPARLLRAAVRALAAGTESPGPRLQTYRELEDCFDAADSVYDSCYDAGMLGTSCVALWALELVACVLTLPGI